MRIAVCCAGAEEARRICQGIRTCAAGLHRDAEPSPFFSETKFWEEFEPGRFHGAVVGYGDAKGFLCARRVREEDRGCRVVLLDDTDRFALQGLRIHLTDYLVRPVEDERLWTAVDRLLIE